MDQREAEENYRMAQLAGAVRQPTDTERLVARIDADIRKLQEWRAHVLGNAPVSADPTALKVRKPRKKKGLPTPPSE